MLDIIRATNISIFKEQTALRGQFMENISDVDIRIARVEELIHAQTDQLQASQFRQPNQGGILVPIWVLLFNNSENPAWYQANIGSRFHFDTLRRVPDSAQCVNFAVKGDIDGLKHPFSHGLASPRDISTSRGYSLLRWALYAKQYETCKFLAYAGADPDYRPFASSDNSPRIKACHFLLEGCPSESGESALKSITQEGHLEDFIEDSRFTSIHRIVLGLCLLDLNTEVAARGDSHTIFVLLNHGADPNITDTQLSGPISNAAARGHTVCVRLLLEAGGDPDPPLPSGVRKGSPLIIATRNAADTMSLLDFGANVNSRGSDG
ncbi:hypothetical protein LOZ58_004949 [Ophidiomyces ophidiicola]|nr:hypothetical protein LOZ58_004949 [Ophidiomyces ophidiicola]